MGEERAGEGGDDATEPRPVVEIDAVAFLIEQVTLLDQVVHAQQAFINALLPEIFKGRPPEEEASDALDGAMGRLQSAFRAQHESKSRWRLISAVALQHQRAAEKAAKP